MLTFIDGNMDGHGTWCSDHKFDARYMQAHWQVNKLIASLEDIFLSSSPVKTDTCTLLTPEIIIDGKKIKTL